MNIKTSVYETNKEPTRRFLGPVANLEDHLEDDWWKKIFNATYLQTDGDVVCDNSLTRSEVNRFIEILSPKKDNAILDLCCGQGRHVLEFARQGFTNLHGFDYSQYLVDVALDTAKTEKLKVNFIQGDARCLDYKKDSMDNVLILGNSFGYFESIDEDQKILKEVRRVLKPEGTLLVDLTDGDYLRENFQERSWEWIDEDHFACRERALSRDGERLISREIVNHNSQGTLVDQFYAERLYSRVELVKLFENVGFSNVTFHSGFETESQRNQDLGMMQKRIIITAKANQL